MADKYTIQEIADYLNGKMNPAEAEILRREAEKDNVLFNEVEEQRQLSRVVQIASLKKKLSAIGKEFELPAAPVLSITRKKKNNWPLIALAAAVTGIILFLVLFKSGQSYNTKLFNKYFTDDTGAPSLMGSSATPFDQAMVYYKAGDYDKAAEDFRELLSRSPGNDTLKYYAGLSLIKTGQSDKALILLGSVKPVAGSDFYNRAQWYQALIHLKQGRTKETAAELMEIEKSQSVYADKAAALKKDLTKAPD